MGVARIGKEDVELPEHRAVDAFLQITEELCEVAITGDILDAQRTLSTGAKRRRQVDAQIPFLPDPKRIGSGRMVFLEVVGRHDRRHLAACGARISATERWNRHQAAHRNEHEVWCKDCCSVHLDLLSERV